MKKNADATLKDVKGNTPVHFAAKSGAGEALQEPVFCFLLTKPTNNSLY